MPERTLKVLCLGYCFPPVTSPESFVTAKTMAAIPDTHVDIITAAPSLFRQPPDHSLDDYVEARFGRIERISGTAMRLLGKIAHIPIRPDRYLTLTGRTVKRARALSPNTYDCLVTRSQYHSVHAAGLKLKKRFPNLPWIACFSDPWSGSIYERKIPVMSAWSQRLERKVLLGADALVFPTAEMQDSFARQNPDVPVAEKSHVVPHGFDPSLYGASGEKHPSQAIRIGMFGSFYGPRTPRLLFDAIELAARDTSLPDFIVQIFGVGSDIFNMELAAHPAALKHAVHGGLLPHTDALARMATCDILTTSDAPMPPPSIFLSSKMIDYLGAYRPVFAITPEGVTADLVRQTGGWTVSPDNPAQIAETLARAIREVSTDKTTPSDDIRSAYHIDRIGERFRAILDQTIAAQSPTS
jgi:hypothetical protein